MILDELGRVVAKVNAGMEDVAGPVLWLSGEKLARLERVLAYLGETESRHFEEASAEEQENHIFRDVTALGELVDGAREDYARLGAASPAPVLVVHAMEQTAVDRLYLGLNHLFDLRVHKTDEGVVVDIYAWDDREACIGLVGSTYAFDAEVAPLEPEVREAGGGG